jgi:hypothetical protein
MKTFKTSTYIVPIIGVGTYWGRFDYESMWFGDEEAERYELICSMKSEGMTLQQIAAALGYKSHSSVSDIIKKFSA